MTQVQCLSKVLSRVLDEPSTFMLKITQSKSEISNKVQVQYKTGSQQIRESNQPSVP